MEKTYSLSEVMELQNQRKALEQRLAVHRERAGQKEIELNALLVKNGVNSIQELSQLCATTNAEMQKYAQQEAQTIQLMQGACDELDKLL